MSYNTTENFPTQYQGWTMNDGDRKIDEDDFGNRNERSEGLVVNSPGVTRQRREGVISLPVESPEGMSRESLESLVSGEPNSRPRGRNSVVRFAEDELLMSEQELPTTRVSSEDESWRKPEQNGRKPNRISAVCVTQECAGQHFTKTPFEDDPDSEFLFKGRKQNGERWQQDGERRQPRNSVTRIAEECSGHDFVKTPDNGDDEIDQQARENRENIAQPSGMRRQRKSVICVQEKSPAGEFIRTPHDDDDEIDQLAENGPQPSESERQQRRSVTCVQQKCPEDGFTKTPYEDDLFAAVDEKPNQISSPIVTRRRASESYNGVPSSSQRRVFSSPRDGSFWSSDSASFQLPTRNGKIVRHKYNTDIVTRSVATTSRGSELREWQARSDEKLTRTAQPPQRGRRREDGEKLEKSVEVGLAKTTTTTGWKDAEATRQLFGDLYKSTWTYIYEGEIRNLASIYPVAKRRMPSHQPSYADIKAKCSNGKLFEDADFEAIDENVFTSRRPPRPFVWRRPGEIVDDPKLIDDTASRMDVAQGRLGDCWFLAGIASMTQHQEMFERVMPRDQGFDSSNYCGAFHFNFWQGGKWVEVIIDDRLPTINNQLIFVHSKSRNEFWSALMEKAYAKMCGSYEALKGGQTSEALEDFTGGLTESFDLGSKAPKNLFTIMLKAQKRNSMMGCSINAKPNQIEAKLDNGLVMGHAYTVTAVRKVNARTRSGNMEVELVRVRNPWGNEREWTGAWGDKSSEWSLLTSREKEEMELTFDDDGEFWMSYRDFIGNFQRLEICMLSPDSAETSSKKIQWKTAVHASAWRPGITAGGCRNFPNSFHMNPQFRVTLVDVDEDDDDDNCTLIVSLMQVGRRKLRRKLGANSNLTIGFAIYKLEDEDAKKEGCLEKDYFLYHSSTARSNTFINSRTLTNRFPLKPGVYCIVPSTFDANEEGDFLLRLYSEKAHPSGVQDEQTRITQPVRPRITATEDQTMDSKYRAFFKKVAGEDEQIDAFELKKVMEAAFSKELGNDRDFNIETCRSLVAMYDDNGTGKLEFDEFKQTLVTVKKCQAEFLTFDKDRSGDMDLYELENVLRSLGIRMSRRCLLAVTCRYSNKKGKVDFDDFLQIYTRTVNLIEIFNSKCDRSGKSVFNIDEFIESAGGL